MPRPPIELPLNAPPLSAPPSFVEQCASFGIELEPQEVEQLGRFLGLLLAANAHMNLTAIRDADEAWTRHAFDALTLLAVLSELPPEARVADVGSGSGVPALPLAIALPELSFQLVESTQKKADFLSRAAEGLGLHHVSVLAERAEDVGRHPNHREHYDAVIARAVGPMRVLVELCSPLVKVGGQCIFIKGERAEVELEEASRALEALHLETAGLLDTPTGKIVVLDKTKRTGKKYPRRPGEPKRAPL